MADNNELWYRLAHDKFPTLSIHEIQNLKLRAAVDYSLANESKLGQLYESYVIMRTLSGKSVT